MAPHPAPHPHGDGDSPRTWTHLLGIVGVLEAGVLSAYAWRSWSVLAPGDNLEMGQEMATAFGVGAAVLLLASVAGLLAVRRSRHVAFVCCLSAAIAGIPAVVTLLSLDLA